MFSYGPELRESLRANLDKHQILSIPADERRRAAVAVVVVDSSVELADSEDDATTGIDMSSVPGDTEGFDGRISGVSGGAAFLLCRRAARMNRHPGQWALPGGKIDLGESVESAALRELEEELGLRVDPSEVLGRLDDYGTRSGFVITPVVVWGGEDIELVPDPAEV